MNINKITNAGVGAITQNEEPELPPQQTLNPGVAGIPDGFETVIPANSIFTVFEPPAQGPQDNLQKDETVDSSEVFGNLGLDSPDSIVSNPNISFEEKLALFLFDFLEKAEKDLLSKMEQLEKSRNTQKSNAAGNQSADIPGATNGQSTDSEQAAMEKLKIAHDKMERIYSTVDNLLTSYNKSIKEGPIASLR